MRILVAFLLAIYPILLVAQPYQIMFTGSGLSTAVSTVEVQNLTQNTVLTLDGTDILELVTSIGIAEESTTMEDLMIYPNPVNHSCRIEFNNTQAGEVNIELFDATGKSGMQNSFQHPQGIHCYNLGGLPSGIFFLKINTPAGSFSKRIISANRGESSPYLTYLGILEHANPQTRLSSSTGVIPMQYNVGERLLFKGSSGIYARVLTLVPTQSQTVDFEFILCTDGDSNHYPVVTIGTQTWMAENLKTTKYNSGIPIPEVTDSIVWPTMSTPAYCWYRNDYSNYGSVYGALYNWYAVEAGTLCPLGWHVPTDAEWTLLTDTLGGDGFAGGPLRATTTTHWISPNTGATNSSGFTALPGGRRNAYYGSFDYLGISGYWWSSTAYSTTNAWSRKLNYGNTMVDSYNDPKKIGFSVRCIKQ